MNPNFYHNSAFYKGTEDDHLAKSSHNEQTFFVFSILINSNSFSDESQGEHPEHELCVIYRSIKFKISKPNRRFTLSGDTQKSNYLHDFNGSQVISLLSSR